MPYLIDLSAWARSGHRDAVDRWTALVEGDELVCHPVFALELLHNAVNAADFRRLALDLDRAFDWVWPDRETASVALGLQRQMATSAPTAQRVKTADLLIAALAVQHGVGVLHYDTDYDAIRERGRGAFVSEWLAKRGSLETVGRSTTT